MYALEAYTLIFGGLIFECEVKSKPASVFIDEPGFINNPVFTYSVGTPPVYTILCVHSFAYSVGTPPVYTILCVHSFEKNNTTRVNKM